MFIFKKLIQLIKIKPVKTIIFTSLSIVLLAVGVINVQMATGNDTLVSRNSDVYQENLALEKTFGGESIIVMYESDNLKNLLTINNFEHMERLERQLIENENIYSIISPVMLVNQMAEKQANKFQEGLTEVVEGLNEMGGKLSEIGDNLIINAEKDSDSQLSNEMFKGMDQGLAKMIEAQKNLQKGTQGLVNGFEQFGEQIRQVGTSVDKTASSIPADQPKEQKQIQQLKQYSQQLLIIAEKMKQTGSNSAALVEVPQQTQNALIGMESGVEKQKKQLVSMQEQQQTQLKELGSGLKEMGDKLKTISENLGNMQEYSDSLSPGLPKTQKTLDYMIYDEEEQLRNMFQKVIIGSKNMMMSIKFKGEVNDNEKSEVVEFITSYLNNNSLKTTDTIVTGKPVLDKAIRTSMQDSMTKMMMLSVGVMIVVLMVTFKVRWRILPLGIVLLAVIGTVGFMGWVSIPVTMVSMAVFPILIGLGIDYSIQFQSRYTEEMEESEGHYESE